MLERFFATLISECGIESNSVVAGTKSLALHQAHEPSGKRIRYQKTAPGPTDEIVKDAVWTEPARVVQIA